MYSFRCNSCSISFLSKFGLNNHKRRWGCTDRNDADVINRINETVFVAGDSNDDNDDRNAKKGIMQKH